MSFSFFFYNANLQLKLFDLLKWFVFGLSKYIAYFASVLSSKHFLKQASAGRSKNRRNNYRFLKY